MNCIRLYYCECLCVCMFFIKQLKRTDKQKRDKSIFFSSISVCKCNCSARFAMPMYMCPCECIATIKLFHNNRILKLIYMYAEANGK